MLEIILNNVTCKKIPPLKIFFLYRKQNREYCEYLINALYYESRNRTDWEKDMLEVDKLEFEATEMNELTEKLSQVLNEGENVKTLDDYKKAALEHFKLKNEMPLSSTN